MAADTPLAPSTLAVAAGRPPRVPGGSTNPPIVLASTYHADGELNYGRDGNPTWSAFEDAVGALEGGTGTAFASGLAAVSAVVDLVPPGGVVVMGPDSYYGSVKQLAALDASGRVQMRLVDLTSVDAAVAALDGAALLWAESPTNPLLRVSDLPALCAAARSAGAIAAVDNTFSTPVLAQPLSFGADVVMHSATKYLAGHSDLLLGVCVTRDPALAARLVAHRATYGNIPGTVEAWLALRGLRTLAVRVRQASANAAELASRLAAHPRVEAVHYPGSGAMVSVVLSGSAEQAEAACNATSLWVHATSLGGVESSLERRRRYAGESELVPETLLRLSVGIEDVDDLWADLSTALTG